MLLTKFNKHFLTNIYYFNLVLNKIIYPVFIHIFQILPGPIYV